MPARAYGSADAVVPLDNLAAVLDQPPPSRRGDPELGTAVAPCLLKTLTSWL